MRVRSYGTSGPVVIVLHGGPGAAGCMAPVARGLAGSFRVLEPFQRRSGGPPLTVARHVDDLHELLATRCAGTRPALVGSSWGAMLALCCAAAHPGRTGPLVLIGCGTFDEAARQRLAATVEERTDATLRAELERLRHEPADPDGQLRAEAELTLPLYVHDPGAADAARLELADVDARGHRETWADMLRLQREAVYPTAFRSIDAPVLMLHGAADPHPGRMIRASLAPHLRRLRYREWRRCGHYPWLEPAVRDAFYAVLRGWLGGHLAGGAGTDLAGR